MDELKRLAKKHNLEVIERSAYHVQVKGKLLVNYYPNSKKRTAYVAGTRKGIEHATPAQVIQLALNPPPTIRGKPERKPQKKDREWLLNKHPFCHWCGVKLTKETATLEHKIPLKRGGLDNRNNKTLACKACNQARGHDMPELKK